MIIQEYFKKRMKLTLNKQFDEIAELDKETVSKILNKSKEEVTIEELVLLNHIFMNNTIGPHGNNYRDDRFKQNVLNMYYYLGQGLTLDEAMRMADETPEIMKNTELTEKNNFIQEYFVSRYKSMTEGTIPNHDLAKETISKILHISKDEVTED